MSRRAHRVCHHGDKEPTRAFCKSSSSTYLFSHILSYISILIRMSSLSNHLLPDFSSPSLIAFYIPSTGGFHTPGCFVSSSHNNEQNNNDIYRVISFYSINHQEVILNCNKFIVTPTESLPTRFSIPNTPEVVQTSTVVQINAAHISKLLYVFHGDDVLLGKYNIFGPWFRHRDAQGT